MYHLQKNILDLESEIKNFTVIYKSTKQQYN